ncbi:MAG: hypothetical protein VX335_05365 [Pseudomonadota bacterium]|nr:hypothetical protein [Pseudomonadota bacterium]
MAREIQYILTKDQVKSACKTLKISNPKLKDKLVDTLYKELNGKKYIDESTFGSSDIDRDAADKLFDDFENIFTKLDIDRHLPIEQDSRIERSNLTDELFKVNKEFRGIKPNDVKEYAKYLSNEDTYKKVRAAKANITNKTVELIENPDTTPEDISEQQAQLARVEQAFYAKREASLTNFAYYGFPLSHLCPSLGLIGATAAGFFLAPLVILLYVAVNTYEEVAKDGLNTKRNKLYVGATFIATLLTAAAIAGFAGATLPFGGALVYPLANAFNIGIFLYGTNLENSRDIEALDIIDVKVTNLVEALDDIKQKLDTSDMKNTVFSSKEQHQEKMSENILNFKKAQLIEKNINVLLYEYTNLVRTIKTDGTKAKHVEKLHEIRNTLLRSCLHENFHSKKLTDDPKAQENNKKLYEKIILLLPTSENENRLNELRQDAGIARQETIGNNIELSDFNRSSRTNSDQYQDMFRAVLEKSRFEIYREDNVPNKDKVYQVTLLSKLLIDLEKPESRDKAHHILSNILHVIGDSPNKKIDINNENEQDLSKKIFSELASKIPPPVATKSTDIYNLINKCDDGTDGMHKYINNLLSTTLEDSGKLEKIIKQDKMLESINVTKSHVSTYGSRDYVYNCFNLALLAANTLLYVAPILGLPLALTPPGMIGIAATVGLFMLVNVTQWYFNREKISAAKEKLFVARENDGVALSTNFKNTTTPSLGQSFMNKLMNKNANTVDKKTEKQNSGPSFRGTESNESSSKLKRM